MYKGAIGRESPYWERREEKWRHEPEIIKLIAILKMSHIHMYIVDA